MTTRYLVTGCAGFIGSHVVGQLLAAGHAVTGVDNLNDAYDATLKRWRLTALTKSDQFEFHELDIGNPSALEGVFRNAGAAAGNAANGAPYAAVINLAARAGVRPSVANPWIYLETNAIGSLNVLELCRRHRVPKYVLASTSSLYGAHNSVPYREDADTTRPLSPYAASKKAAEAMAYTYHHLHGLDVSIVRYFTVYGPAGRPDMSVFRFVQRIAAGRPLVVYGDGEQRRDFTFVEDIVRGTIAALRPLGYDVINLGGDAPVSITSLIERISALVGRRPQIEYQSAHAADVPVTWADISKAKQALDWRPRVSLDEGLQRTVAWHRENDALVESLQTSTE